MDWRYDETGYVDRVRQVHVVPSAEAGQPRCLTSVPGGVSDIAWRVHPDYRGDQSLDKIAHAGMTGIDHPGRIFLGLSVYFRHTGTDGNRNDGLPQKLAGRIDRRLLKRARIVGGALRVAHMLSIGMPGVIDETRLTYNGNKLVLTLPRAHADLDGERLRRRFDVLASLLGHTGEIRLAP